MRTFGPSLGTAPIGIILAVFSSRQVDGVKDITAQRHAVHVGFWISVGAPIIAVVISLGRIRKRRSN